MNMNEEVTRDCKHSELCLSQDLKKWKKKHKNEIIGEKILMITIKGS